MKVFLSWSGSPSREAAEILRELLPCMLQGMDVFLSKHDIKSGTRWGQDLARELEATDFGILCLTADNQGSPWLLYEAGALTKQLEARACGLLIGDLSPANVSGPLAQFQHRKFDRADMEKLFRDLNAIGKAPLPSEQATLVFSKWWPDMESRYSKLLKAKVGDGKAANVRTDRELLEEILIRLRGSASQTPEIADSEKAAIAQLRTLVSRLPLDQRALLLRIAAAKREEDTETVDEIGAENSDALMALIELGYASRDNSGVVRMSKHLSRRVLGDGYTPPAEPGS